MSRPLLRIAFLVVVLGLGGATVLWSVRQNEAYRRDVEAMGRSPESLSPPGQSVEVAYTPPRPQGLSVVTSSGRPVAGARIYANDFAGGYSQRLGTSDARGRVSIVRQSAGLALAPDGRITMLDDPERIVFGPRATLRLRLTDGQGVPGAGKRITVVPTPWLPSYDEMGVVDRLPKLAPELTKRLTRTTDASGIALFTGLAKDQKFQVFVHLDGGRALSFDKWVQSGSRKEIVVARNRRIEGRVTRASGAPLAGMKVELAVTNDGRFPTLTRRWATTDREGRYRFDHLLTCGYSIRLDAPAKALEEGGWVDARREAGPWISRRYDGPPPRGEWNANEYLRLWPQKLVTTCDFRWTRSAYLDVEIALATPTLQLNRIFIKRSGEDAWADSSDAGQHVHFAVRPATYEIYMETKRRTEERAVDGYLGKVTLTEGERNTFRFTAGR